MKASKQLKVAGMVGVAMTVLGLLISLVLNIFDADPKTIHKIFGASIVCLIPSGFFIWLGFMQEVSER